MENLFRFGYWVKNKMRFLELKVLGSISILSGAISISSNVTKRLQSSEQPKEIKAEIQNVEIKEPTPLS